MSVLIVATMSRVGSKLWGGHTCSQASHLAVRPLLLSLPTMTYGRANRKCIAAVVEHTVAQ